MSCAQQIEEGPQKVQDGAQKSQETLFFVPFVVFIVLFVVRSAFVGQSPVDGSLLRSDPACGE